MHPKIIPDENFSPILLKALAIPESKLVGFTDHGRTKPRTVTHYEVVLFMKNGGNCTIDGKTFPIEEGCIRIHKPGNVVFSSRYHNIFVVHFSAGEEMAACSFLSCLSPFMKAKYPEEFLRRMKRCAAALAKKDPMEQKCAVYALIDALLQESAGLDTPMEETPMETVASYIAAHFRQNLTLSELGQVVFLHPHYLQAKFKKEMGISPAEYLLSVRLEHARLLLEDSHLSLEAISEECGFCNASYFIRQFRVSLGETPGAYRARITADIRLVL